MSIVLLGVENNEIASLGEILKELGIHDIVHLASSDSHPDYVIKSSDIVIYSDDAIDSEELKTAHELAKNNTRKARYPLSYDQFIGEISKYFETVAIAGTHKKSSTTALTTYALSQLDDHLGLGIVNAFVPQFDHKSYWLSPVAKEDIKKIFTYILEGKLTERDESLRKKYRFFCEANIYLDVDHVLLLEGEIDHMTEFLLKIEQNIRTINNRTDTDYIKNICKDKELHLISPSPISLPQVFDEGDHNNASLIYAMLATFLGRKKFEIGPDEEIVATMKTFSGL